MMMKNNTVVLVEIPASNCKKAKACYEKVFDWKIELRGAGVDDSRG